jgi:hypothetical protein
MIPNTVTSVQYVSNGTTTAFAFANKVFQAQDLAITAIDLSGNLYSFTFTSGSKFANNTLGLTATISNVDVDTGCTVTLSAPLASSWQFDIRSAIAETQLTSIKNQGAFLPDLHEEAFDKLTRELQDLRRLCYQFGIHGPDIEATPWTQLPNAAGRANQVLAFDGNGLPQVVTVNGTGTNGSNAVQLSASNPAIIVPATNLGVVTSFATAVGQCSLYSGLNNVTGAAAWSISALNNCTATVTAQGAYAFSALTGLSGSATIQAVYLGNVYTITITIAASVAGAAGAAGPAGPTGPQGSPGSGTSAISISLQNPALGIVGYANGTYPSSSLPVGGQAYVYSGGTLVNSSCTWSAVAANCTGTVNTATNTPVAGPIGYYQVTALSASVGTLTISAVYQGTTFTATFTVNVIPGGYAITNNHATYTPTFEGLVVYDSTDGQLWRYHSGAWTTVVPAVNITGTIVGTQIANGTITTANIAANTITAANIQANTITSTQIAANTISSNQILAGSIVAASLGVSQLAAISANLGTVTAGIVQNSGGSAKFDLNNGFIEFNNGTYMKVSGVGFGAGGNYLEWYGPTQSAASNFVACTDALGIYWIKTDGTSYFGGTTKNPVLVNTYKGSAAAVEVIPVNSSKVIIEIYGGGGPGGNGFGTSCTGAGGGGGGAGGYCKKTLTLNSGNWGQTMNVSTLLAGNNATVTSGTFTVTTLTANEGNAGANATSNIAPGGGGSGGTATNGDVNTTGGAGGNGATGQVGGTGGVGITGNTLTGNSGGHGAAYNGAGIGAATVAQVVFTYY